jgi:plasmid stabilization system protein ParE
LKKIILSDRAEAELEDAVGGYHQINPNLGARFYRTVLADLFRIRQFPKAQPEFDARHRYLVMRQFPYLLIYRETIEYIAVEAIAYARQNRDTIFS